MKSKYYKAFGLIFRSEVELPELQPVDAQPSDVVISIGQVPTKLKEVRTKGILYSANPNEFLFILDKIASYYVSNGNHIQIQPIGKVNPSELRLFLLGTTMGALIFQRGLFPLHGSSIKESLHAHIFVGESTSGKSSLAARFSQIGFPIISDDISVLSQNNKGDLIIYPGIPHVRLWQDVIDHLKISGRKDRIRPGLQKYRSFDLPHFNKNPLIVKSIIALSTKNTPNYSIKKMTGVDKFKTLKENTYRYNLIEGLGQIENHFNIVSKMSSIIDIYKVERPSYPLDINNLADFILTNVFNEK